MVPTAADVFISYARPDYDTAQRVARTLALINLKAWWDDRIELSQGWEEVITTNLAAANSVLVLWSKNSVESEWVNRVRMSVWTRCKNFISQNRRDLAAAGAVVSAALSALAALNSWNSARETAATAKKVAAVQASIAFKDNLPKNPGASACMSALAGSTNSTDALTGLLTHREFTLQFSNKDAVMPNLRTCILSGKEPTNFRNDEPNIRAASMFAVNTDLSRDIYARLFQHLNTYESMALFYAQRIASQNIICQQINPGYQESVRDFLQLLTAHRSHEAAVIRKEIPSLMSFYTEVGKDADCAALAWWNIWGD
jgi:hypothetical protein